MATQRRKKIEGQVRLICTLPNASTCISEVAFATVQLEVDAPPVHLSELVDAAKAEPFLVCEGFAVWDGDEATHARTIEDALDAARRGPSAAGERGDRRAAAGLRQQITELTAANQAQARELREVKQRVKDLEAANTALTRENDALKATGARAAA